MLAPSGGGLILYQSYGNLYVVTGRKSHLLEDKQIPSVEVPSRKQRLLEEWDTSGTLPCQLPPKELNLGSFTLPCTIGNLNLYVMEDLGASVNIMPKSIFKHLKPANLKETSMVVEMADIIKKASLGIVENIMDCGMWPTCNPDLSFCRGYDAIYVKGKNGMLEQWMCFRDHERQSIGGNRMVFADFLKVRYGNKVIEDTTRERQYYEWVTQNSEFNDNGVAQKATIYDNPYSFDIQINFGKTLDDPYSRRFDEYKEEFDSKIKQLANEYDLRVGSRKKNGGKVA
nr:hypothetical protein [Tanacetum cinerariifolium]